MTIFFGYVKIVPMYHKTHWTLNKIRARFETCAHKWVDLSEGGYGVSLFPHAGNWDECTQAEAYALNDPILVFYLERGDNAAYPPVLPASFLRVDQPNAIIETVKLAEDSDGLIVRLYESHRKRGPVNRLIHHFDNQGSKCPE